MNLFSTSFKISIAEIIIQLDSDEIIELESGYEREQKPGRLLYQMG